jgi:hypothetical protein
MIPNVAEKNILILVEGKKKNDSKFLAAIPLFSLWRVL